MKILYLDCFSGISGDMMVGALVDAGVPPEKIEVELKKLPLSGYQLQWGKVMKKGISATKFDVIMLENIEDSHDHERHHAHRHYSDIVDMIERSELNVKSKNEANKFFIVLLLQRQKSMAFPLKKFIFTRLELLTLLLTLSLQRLHSRNFMSTILFLHLSR